MRRASGAALLALLLAACSSADKPKPAPLEEVKPQVQIAGRTVWERRVDGGVRFPLAIAVAGGTANPSFTVAGGEGEVAAFRADTGAPLWRGDVRASITAGVGSDGRYAAVVTRDTEVVVLDAGNVKWRAKIGSRASTAPLVAGDRVFVMGVDRVVNAFDAATGRRLWTLKRPGEPLTLSQRGVLAAYKNTLLAGQGSRLAGIDPRAGRVLWEVPIALPRGTNEVERLADLVGPMARDGNVVCARAFQAAVGCVDADSGKQLWTKPAAGVEGVSADAQLLFGADANSRITAWRTANGETAWTSEKLLYRALGAPLATGKTVIFGDGQGMVHFLSRDSGETLLRLPTDGSPVVAGPTQAGMTVLVATRNGGLFAFRPE